MSGGSSLESSNVAAEGRLSWLFDPKLLVVALASAAVVVGGGLVQVSFGAYSMTLSQAWAAVFNPEVIFNAQAWSAFLFGGEVPEMSRESLIVWNIRLPRVFVGILVGMNLGVSGAIFQAVTRNELASPFILGVSSGAGLLILLTLVVFGSLTAFLPLIASLGGAGAFLIVYVIAWKGGTSPVRLVLAGVIVGTVFGSLQTALFFFAEDIGVVQSAIAWTTGSLTGTDWQQVRLALPWTLVAVSLSVAGSRQCNVLLLGESTARSLGMSIERVRFALSGVAVLAAAASIAVAGIVGFVGLIVPHMVRNLVGSDYRKLMVGCLFVGPALMVGADVGARLALNPVQIPVGIVTGLVGGPYFLYLMRKQQNMGEI
ncbi:FecCD family ABC transporter permease [Halalkalicoccus jeotgali]|uniref:Cobalamin import system permease protein BtuC n=1 Tax=Halalkalicoccus jeotgali (strain DSM 18796 / CECT 7217 / JCM 14584 / KCTC 4019 / B3) TaxID=795797 RepID=D8J872_HALJB|nr:iron ABC transporter permease [Halalkalicoccus jeotgali]ADJ14185.1 transport system permease protein [Halalkalicoccus jeotgali B3]ELY34633.1 transport system permease [Halalkalicoccus jeotgali B3]